MSWNLGSALLPLFGSFLVSVLLAPYLGDAAWAATLTGIGKRLGDALAATDRGDLKAAGEVLAPIRGELGDLRARNDVGADRWRDGGFLSPHCARWDSRGDLYVMDWNFLGRISKLERVR